MQTITQGTRSLVLELWKFIHISRLQKEYGISDADLSEIAPMAPSVIEGMNKVVLTEDEPLPSISDLIKV